MMQILTGEHRHTLDAKGRLCIPARFLRALGDTFYVFKAPDNCLNVYSKELWEKLAHTISEMEPEKARKLRRALYPSAQECAADGQGRILLSQDLRDYAGIGSQATVVGSEKYVEIWSAERWDCLKNGENAESLGELMKTVRV